jgi:hypothetical protein
VTGELLEDMRSEIPRLASGSSRVLLDRVRSSRLGRPIYEEKVTIKLEIPARLNDLLEQLKILGKIPKNEMITFALEKVLQQGKL